MRKAIAILPVVSAIYPMITYQPWLDIIHDDTTSQPADKELMNRTRFQTGQSASYHKQRQNEEVETVVPASRYEHQGTDTEENQSGYHTPPVAPLPDNPSGRQRHQKVGTIDSSLRQSRHRLADMERLLEMWIQHLQDAMGKAPHEEEAADDEERHQIVMPFVSEDGWLRHDSLQI